MVETINEHILTKTKWTSTKITSTENINEHQQKLNEIRKRNYNITKIYYKLHSLRTRNEIQQNKKNEAKLQENKNIYEYKNDYKKWKI